MSTREPQECAAEKISGDLEALNALWREVACRGRRRGFWRSARRSPRPC